MSLLRQMTFLRRRNLACLRRPRRWPCRSAFWVNVPKASPGLIAKTVPALQCRPAFVERLDSSQLHKKAVGERAGDSRVGSTNL
ncbi:hypothetical protein CCHR01_15642 [Colletotrichum chrysophilum]|uniref:Uncharacterized protein n=1 Tax=Colletotrichum chrysophilum TaxID=1836956 RepID=A0AAD9A5F5_9PEZI|nr:hypothetical protein CCHR01_15642 [Colletotrichum chrysophilum]